MDLRRKLISEVEYASHIMQMSPVRSLPKEIVLEEFDPIPGYRSGVLISENKMIISSKLNGSRLNAVIKREALIHLIPPKAEKVPQVLDLAWAYSGAPENWWRECSSTSYPNLFQNYDPPGFFSLIPRKKRIAVLRSLLAIVRTLVRENKLDFPIFYYLIRRNASISFKPRPAENKVLKAIKKNPYANQKEIAEISSISPASVSRSISRLRRVGYLYGPMNVNLHRLGLISTIITFPNLRTLRNIFLSFPFTFRIFEPCSERINAHASVLIPMDAIDSFRSLEDMGIKVHQVILQKFLLNLNPPKNLMESMVRRYERKYKERRAYLEYSLPKIKVTKEDLRILNIALTKGDLKSSELINLGVKSPRYRISKLKNAGLLDYYYTLGEPQHEDDLLVRIRSREEEFVKLVETIGAATTLVGNHLRGSWEGFFGVLLPKDHLRGRLIRALRLLFRDRLEIAEDAIDYRSEWTIPIHLWDEDKQRFIWEEEFESLFQNLSIIKDKISY